MAQAACLIDTVVIEVATPMDQTRQAGDSHDFAGAIAKRLRTPWRAQATMHPWLSQPIPRCVSARRRRARIFRYSLGWIDRLQVKHQTQR